MTLPITTADKLQELKREGHQRSRNYPKLIEKGWLTPEKAERQNAILRAIILDYEAEVYCDTRENMFGKVRKSAYDTMLSDRRPLSNAERCRSCFMSLNNDERLQFVVLINAIVAPRGGRMTFSDSAVDATKRERAG
jgi:hypothetical protein